MLNEFHGSDGRTDGHRDSEKEVPAGAPLSDREVPLNPRRTPAVVQAWLDGEVSMVDASRGDTGSDVEFWNRLNEQAAERRHMRTPVHVQQRIMQAIPQAAPSAETSWFQRDSHLSYGKLLLAGAALVSVAIAAAILLA